MTMTMADRERVTEQIDNIAYKAHELKVNCKDLATFLVPDNHKHAGEIRRVARMTAELLRAIEDLFGNLPRIDEN